MNTAPKLVLLDVGMVAELTPEDQQNLVGFFKVCMHSALPCCECFCESNLSQQCPEAPEDVVANTDIYATTLHDLLLVCKKRCRAC